MFESVTKVSTKETPVAVGQSVAEPHVVELAQHSFMRACVGELSDVTFGRSVARGLSITFSEGVPSLHIKAISVGSVLKSVSEQSYALAESISRYQYIRGVTPSKEGLRVFSLVLQKLSDGGKETRREIRSLAQEAAALDLADKKNATWCRALSISVCGLPVSLKFSLERRPTFERIASRIVGTDLPHDAHKNILSYKIEISPSDCKSSHIIVALKNKVRQVAAVSTIVAPIAAASTAEFVTGASEALMKLSDRGTVKFALENLCDFGIPALTGFAVISLRNWWRRRKEL